MKIFWSVWCLLLCLPGQALAEHSFEISCMNVQKICVVTQGQGWSVGIDLTPEGADTLRRFTLRHRKQEVTITANGEALVRDVVHAPLPFGSLELWASTREEAQQQAQRICPTRVASPVEFLRPYPMEHPELVDSPTFEVTCDMVHSMWLWKGRDAFWRDRSVDGHYYMLHVKLNPAAGWALTSFRSAQPERTLGEGSTAVSVKHVQLAVKGQRIRSDLPELDGIRTEGAWLIWRTLDAAMAAARTICPEKAPATMRVPRTFGAEEVPLPGEE